MQFRRLLWGPGAVTWIGDAAGRGLQLQNNKIIVPRLWLPSQEALTITIALTKKDEAASCVVNYNPDASDRLTAFLYAPTIYNGAEIQSHVGIAWKPATPIGAKGYHVYSFGRTRSGSVFFAIDAVPQPLVSAGDSIGEVATTHIEIGARGTDFYVTGHVPCIIFHRRALSSPEISNMHIAIMRQFWNEVMDDALLSRAITQAPTDEIVTLPYLSVDI
ncbi:MAG: hypothetical protein KatS3mg038_2953 [Candidatus Kapaibacterium sp.]|nr:MAG: hypothetical protein KatS3mg038_2953 [Candidatus Kapabacteria bacterium]